MEKVRITLTSRQYRQLEFLIGLARINAENSLKANIGKDETIDDVLNREVIEQCDETARDVKLNMEKLGDDLWPR